MPKAIKDAPIGIGKAKLSSNLWMIQNFSPNDVLFRETGVDCSFLGNKANNDLSNQEKGAGE